MLAAYAIAGFILIAACAIGAWIVVVTIFSIGAMAVRELFRLSMEDGDEPESEDVP